MKLVEWEFPNFPSFNRRMGRTYLDENPTGIWKNCFCLGEISEFETFAENELEPFKEALSAGSA